MPNIVSSFICMYADDTKISRVMSDTLDSIKLQADLNNIQKWSEPVYVNNALANWHIGGHCKHRPDAGMRRRKI